MNVMACFELQGFGFLKSRFDVASIIKTLHRFSLRSCTISPLLWDKPFEHGYEAYFGGETKNCLQVVSRSLTGNSPIISREVTLLNIKFGTSR